MNQLWCNGQWLDFSHLPVHPCDRGLLHGLGLFETLLALDGRLVLADRHLARLRAAGGRLGWEIDFPNFEEIASELLVRNGLVEGRARVRLAITAGSGPLADLQLGSDWVVWMTGDSCEDPPASLAVCISPWLRNERSPLAGLKSASYAENLIALDHARKQGFDETIHFNTAGHLCEAAMANVFLVKDDHLLTPRLESGCLPGITRDGVIELAAIHGILCEQRDLTLADLQGADEIFLTSSIRGLSRVSRLDQRMLPFGPMIERLAQSWDELIGRTRLLRG